ncbi:MAG: hypothetical protein IT379_00355 [Deltaproteobacteria bacterium]|nr:hypothetical protein [Deltaproteobacteria bacterium]
MRAPVALALLFATSAFAFVPSVAAAQDDGEPIDEVSDAGPGGDDGEPIDGDEPETGISPEMDDSACGELNADDCRRAGRSFLIAFIAYDVGALLLALGLYWVFSRRGSFRQLVNLFIPLLLFPAAAVVLVALDPMRDPNFASCVACEDYSSTLILAGMGDWPRALILGAAPVAVAYFLIVLIWNRLGK